MKTSNVKTEIIKKLINISVYPTDYSIEELEEFLVELKATGRASPEERDQLYKGIDEEVERKVKRRLKIRNN